jgi:hypothetical protein
MGRLFGSTCVGHVCDQLVLLLGQALAANVVAGEHIVLPGQASGLQAVVSKGLLPDSSALAVIMMEAGCCQNFSVA